MVINATNTGKVDFHSMKCKLSPRHASTTALRLWLLLLHNESSSSSPRLHEELLVLLREHHTLCILRHVSHVLVIHPLLRHHLIILWRESSLHHLSVINRIGLLLLLLLLLSHALLHLVLHHILGELLLHSR